MAQHQRKTGSARSDDGSGTFRWILIAVAVVGVLAIGYAVWSGGSGTAATGPVSIEGVDARSLAQQAEPMRKGDPNAPVQIVEFADYQCPGCAHFATRVEAQIRSAYVDQGRVQLVYYDFPLPGHPHSFLASRAARCAGDQQREWEYHDVLYARQTEWSPSRSAPIDRFVEYASTLGIDAGAFEDCLRSDRHAENVTANSLVGQQLGVRSTPTVFVNGRSAGNAWDDYQEMRELIDAALATTPAPQSTDAPESDTVAAATGAGAPTSR